MAIVNETRVGARCRRRPNPARCSHWCGRRSPECSARRPPPRSCGARGGRTPETGRRRRPVRPRIPLPRCAPVPRTRRAAPGERVPIAFRALVAGSGGAGGADGTVFHRPARAGPELRARGLLWRPEGRIERRDPPAALLRRAAPPSTGSQEAGCRCARSTSSRAAGRGQDHLRAQMLFPQAVRDGRPLSDDAFRRR